MLHTAERSWYILKYWICTICTDISHISNVLPDTNDWFTFLSKENMLREREVRLFYLPVCPSECSRSRYNLPLYSDATCRQNELTLYRNSLRLFSLPAHSAVDPSCAKIHMLGFLPVYLKLTWRQQVNRSLPLFPIISNKLLLEHSAINVYKHNIVEIVKLNKIFIIKGSTLAAPSFTANISNALITPFFTWT